MQTTPSRRHAGRQRLSSTLAAVSMLLIAFATTSCEEDGAALTISPANASLGPNVATYTLAVVSGARDLSLPFEWSVTNSDLGRIVKSWGYYAVYARTANSGVNVIRVRDQYGAEGSTTVQQVDFDTAAPAVPVVTAPEETDDETGDDEVLPASEFPGTLGVSSDGGSPSVTLDSGTGSATAFDIAYDINGDVESYKVEYEGNVYGYP